AFLCLRIHEFVYLLSARLRRSDRSNTVSSLRIRFSSISASSTGSASICLMIGIGVAGALWFSVIMSKLIQSVFVLSVLCSMDPLSANAEYRCRWPVFPSPLPEPGICRIPWCPDPPEYDHEYDLVIGQPGPDGLHSTVHELSPAEEKALKQARLLV